MLFRDEDKDLEVLPFADRAEAGRILARKSFNSPPSARAQYRHPSEVVLQVDGAVGRR
jgi:hypothetical protein